MIKKGQLNVKQLKYNTSNSFYVSYVLQHHYDIFLDTLAKIKN